MKPIVATCEFGTVTWRMPNVIEEMRIYGVLGLSMNGKLKNDNDFILTANAMDACADLVTAIDITIGDVKVTTWDQLVEHSEVAGLIAGMATDLLNHVMKVSKKKPDAEPGETTSRAPSRKKKKA